MKIEQIVESQRTFELDGKKYTIQPTAAGGIKTVKLFGYGREYLGEVNVDSNKEIATLYRVGKGEQPCDYNDLDIMSPIDQGYFILTGDY